MLSLSNRAFAINSSFSFASFFYLFKVKNYFDFSLVPILSGVCLLNCQGLCLFLSVDFNFLVNLFVSILKFQIVFGRGILQSQGDISIVHCFI